MGSRPEADSSNPGKWWLAWFFGAEVIAWIVVALLGFEGTTWLLAVTFGVGVVFFMIWGSVRVLRGHDL